MQSRNIDPSAGTLTVREAQQTLNRLFSEGLTRGKQFLVRLEGLPAIWVKLEPAINSKKQQAKNRFMQRSEEISKSFVDLSDAEITDLVEEAIQATRTNTLQ